MQLNVEECVCACRELNAAAGAICTMHAVCTSGNLTHNNSPAFAEYMSKVLGQHDEVALALTRERAPIQFHALLGAPRLKFLLAG